MSVEEIDRNNTNVTANMVGLWVNSGIFVLVVLPVRTGLLARDTVKAISHKATGIVGR